MLTPLLLWDWKMAMDRLQLYSATRLGVKPCI